ncbi:hypothetical protein ACI6Q2_03955 [Chitinophagaceae bacterium LWZ2-11]
MKKIVACILCLSLYAPHAARILVYTQCSVSVMLNDGDKQWCDCMLSKDATTKHSGATTLPDKQNEISKKSDWKYVALKEAAHNIPEFILTKKKYKTKVTILPDPLLSSVFHPPLGLA